MIHIAKNVKLYRAIFDIIRSMDLCSALDDDAIISLLGHLREFVASTDYYMYFNLIFYKNIYIYI